MTISKTVRSTPMYNAAAGLLLLSAIPIAKADCHFDAFGERRCDGLSTGARIGIGIGIFVLGVLIISALAFQRRRRIHRFNQTFITSPNTQYPPGNPTNVGQPQYPPPSHAPSFAQHPAAPPPAGGYNAQPFSQGAPPEYMYAPPPGPPPKTQ